MGTLYLVGTPIGNLEDIAPRALRTLREVAVIAAEDTRQTRKLIAHFGIHTPMVSYHRHNQRSSGPDLINRLLAGDDVALVSDAGMPGISDPGEDLVRLAVEAGVRVVAIPGPTALTTALVISGLPVDRFVFEGFLPLKKRDRLEALQRLKDEWRTWVLYEAPHRLIQTLGELNEVVGARAMAVARELTKIHEEVLRGTPNELLDHFQAKTPRGEMVLIVSGKAPTADERAQEATPGLLAETVAQLEAAGMDRKAAMKEVAKRFGLPRREVYQALLQTKEES